MKVKNETLLHMESRWKESESKLSKMEADKEKLETFAKKSLANFKDKYLAIIHKNKADKENLEKKLKKNYLNFITITNFTIFYFY